MDAEIASTYEAYMGKLVEMICTAGLTKADRGPLIAETNTRREVSLLRPMVPLHGEETIDRDDRWHAE